MPQPPTIFPKLHVSTRPPESLSATSTMASFPVFGPPQHPSDASPHHQVFRTKRKHVLKACDRCRVKKTKCDGNQPCYRCAAYNHPCLFRERKATQTKVYSKGFVEMLESHHALVVKALQQLYAHCIKDKCFPGEPIDVVDGYPLTHAILDRLGLIKQAEEIARLGESPEQFQCWKSRTMSTDSTDTDDISSEKACSLELSPSSEGASISLSDIEAVKTEPPFVSPHSSYDVYNCSERLWPLEVSSTQAMDFGHAFPTTGFNLAGECIANRHPDGVPSDSYGPSVPGDCRALGPGPSVHSIHNTPYLSHSGISYHGPSDAQAGIEQQSWPSGMWTR